MRLEGKVIIVTGAAAGLGRQYAIRFAKEGAKLTIADVQNLEKTTELCRSEGAEVLALQVDVSSEEAMLDMAKQTHDTYGRIDGLLNNAGMMRGLEVKSILDVDMETWDRVFAVNARGTFLGVRAVFPYMREQNSGTIVNVSSGSTLRISRGPNAMNPHYVASKSGITGMTKSIAMELAKWNITVNCVSPGFIKTNMTERLNEEQKKIIINKIPLGMIGSPTDIANCVEFLASEDSRYITGETIHVNGGMAML